MRPRPLRSTDHDAASSGREGAPGLRLYRHAQGHRWARDAGPGRVAARPLLRPSLRVPGPEGQPHQNRVLGRHRPLPVHQTARARRVPVAVERRTWRTLMLTSAQLSMLIDGVDWRAPERQWRPAVAG